MITDRRSGEWFSPMRFGALLALMLVAAFPKVVLGLETFFYRDFGVIGYPTLWHFRESFWQGALPLWNPLSNCGVPFLAQWGTMALYPGSLFYAVLPVPWAVNVFCLAHLWLAGFGMFLLARRWTGSHLGAAFAGTAFVFNGVTLSCLLWPNYTVALGWMPLVVLFGERASRDRGIIVAGLVSAMQLLAGVPEIVVFTWLVVVGNAAGYALLNRAEGLRVARRVLIIVLIATGLTAVQLLPFLDLLANSQREVGLVQTSKWSLPLSGWVNFVVPLFRCFQTPQGVYFQMGQEFMSSVYLGAATCGLGGFALLMVRCKRVWLLGMIAVFAVVMAIGEGAPPFAWLKQSLPLLSIARYPVKFVLLVAFAVPLLAAFSVAHVQATAPAKTRRGLVIIATVVAAFIVLVVVYARAFPQPWEQSVALLRNSAARVVLAIATLGALGAIARFTQSIHHAAVATAIAVLLFADGIRHVPTQNPTLRSDVLTPGLWEAYNKTPPPRHGLGRVMITPRAEEVLLTSGVTSLHQDFVGKRLALWSNLNLIEGVPKVNGSATLQLKHQAEIQKALYAKTNGIPSGLLDFLGAKYMSGGSNVFDWMQRPAALPIVTAGQRPIFADASETIEALLDSAFDAQSVVYLPTESQAEFSQVAASKSNASVSELKVTSRTVSFRVETDQPTVVVVAQSFSRNWRATVGGVRVPVWRANHAFQAVKVPAGQSAVKLEYVDRHFQTGAIISALTLGGCGIYLSRRRGRSSEKT